MVVVERAVKSYGWFQLSPSRAPETQFPMILKFTSADFLWNLISIEATAKIIWLSCIEFPFALSQGLPASDLNEETPIHVCVPPMLLGAFAIPLFTLR
jgi:hypothetical protein